MAEVGTSDLHPWSLTVAAMMVVMQLLLRVPHLPSITPGYRWVLGGEATNRISQIMVCLAQIFKKGMAVPSH